MIVRILSYTFRSFVLLTVDDQSWMLHPPVPNGIVTHLWAGTAPETADYNGKVSKHLSMHQCLILNAPKVPHPMGESRKAKS